MRWKYAKRSTTNVEQPRLQKKTFNHWRVRRVCIVLYALGLTGCTTLKQAGIVGAAAGAGAVAGTAFSGGVAAPILGATGSAFVVDAMMGVTSSPAAQIIEAPDNLFSVVQRLVELTGWGLILVFVAPIVLGWLLPGPLERKRAKPQ